LLWRFFMAVATPSPLQRRRARRNYLTARNEAISKILDPHRQVEKCS
jgi:hypothetical protein